MLLSWVKTKGEEGRQGSRVWYLGIGAKIISIGQSPQFPNNHCNLIKTFCFILLFRMPFNAFSTLCRRKGYPSPSRVNLNHCRPHSSTSRVSSWLGSIQLHRRIYVRPPLNCIILGKSYSGSLFITPCYRWRSYGVKSREKVESASHC